jgi:formiminoglutamate deiminase
VTKPPESTRPPGLARPAPEPVLSSGPVLSPEPVLSSGPVLSPGPVLPPDRYWCEYAWVGGRAVAGVVVTVVSGVITDVAVTGAAAPSGVIRLPGLVLPGMANAHSHAFHRALRGRTHGGGGTFWTWREAMYDLAGRLDPPRYLALARAAYAELVLAGWTTVGEFHYLHHPAGGGRYGDPNELGHALREAAAQAGIRLTLLDTCYLTGGIGEPVRGVQRRFSDGTAAAWARRVGELRDGPGFRVGAAVHSVRAVPARELPDVVEAAAGRPLHVHVSEQPAENEACLAGYGCTPVRLLHDTGVLGPRTTAVHATHLDPGDVVLLGATGTTVAPCPTTEADLADGIGPMRALADAGCPLALGTDQHAAADPFGEARGLEAGERLSSLRRGRFSPAELVTALTSSGHAALGWPDCGRLEPGTSADLVAVRLDTPRTAGCDPGQAIMAATAADVHTVLVEGQLVVAEGRHTLLGDAGALLASAVAAVW